MTGHWHIFTYILYTIYREQTSRKAHEVRDVCLPFSAKSGILLASKIDCSLETLTLTKAFYHEKKIEYESEFMSS